MKLLRPSEPKARHHQRSAEVVGIKEEQTDQLLDLGRDVPPEMREFWKGESIDNLIKTKQAWELFVYKTIFPKDRPDADIPAEFPERVLTSDQILGMVLLHPESAEELRRTGHYTSPFYCSEAVNCMTWLMAEKILYSRRSQELVDQAEKEWRSDPRSRETPPKYDTQGFQASGYRVKGPYFEYLDFAVWTRLVFPEKVGQLKLSEEWLQEQVHQVKAEMNLYIQKYRGFQWDKFLHVLLPLSILTAGDVSLSLEHGLCLTPKKKDLKQPPPLPNRLEM